MQEVLESWSPSEREAFGLNDNEAFIAHADRVLAGLPTVGDRVIGLRLGQIGLEGTIAADPEDGFYLVQFDDPAYLSPIRMQESAFDVLRLVRRP